MVNNTRTSTIKCNNHGSLLICRVSICIWYICTKHFTKISLSIYFKLK